MQVTEKTPDAAQNSVLQPANKAGRRKNKISRSVAILLFSLAGLFVIGLSLWSVLSSGLTGLPAVSKETSFLTPTSGYLSGTDQAFSASILIYDIVADPAEYQVLFAASSTGLLKSSDGGRNWTALNSPEIRGLPVISLAFDNDDQERPVYAGTAGKGLFKSVDGGKSWTNLGLKNRNIVYLSAVKSKVYAAANGSFAGLYHSLDSGKTFSPSDPGNLPPDVDIRTVAVDPENPQNVFIGTAISSNPRNQDVNRVKVSRDSGKTWNSLGNWNTGVSGGPDPLKPVTFLLQAPGDRTFIGDGDKLFRLSPDRATWLDGGTGLPGGVYALASDPQIPGIVYAAAKDGFYRNTGGTDWQKLDAGKKSPFSSSTNSNYRTNPNMVAVNTHTNAVSVNGLNSTFLYALDSSGNLVTYENRDFGKSVVAPVPGFKEPDFSAYNGVNPATPVDPPPADAPLDPAKTYFPETKHYVASPIKEFWDKNGGLSAFGYPLTEEFSEFLPFQNTTRKVQYFERVRLEIDPSAKPGQEVSVGLLGRDAVSLKYYVPGRYIPNTSDQAYFPETRHTLRLGFFQFWSRNGGVSRFGFPLSEEIEEKNVIDGKSSPVQYFERVKLEYNKETNQVQIGNLGRELLIKRGWIKI